MNKDIRGKRYSYVEPRNPLLNPEFHCVFCNTKRHSSHSCRKFRSNEEFYHEVVKQRRCKNCLRQFHRSDYCFNDSFCTLPHCHRKDKHSPSVCRKRFSNKNDKSHRPSIWSELYKKHFSNKNDESRRPSIWSELYKQNYSNKNNDESSRPSVWSELYKKNVTRFRKNPQLSIQQKSSSTQCLTVSTLKSEETNHISQGTQTDERYCYSSGNSPSRYHCSEAILSSISSVNSLRYNNQERLVEYLKIPCSIYCNCKIKDSFSDKSKVSIFQSNLFSHKDFFMNILV